MMLFCSHSTDSALAKALTDLLLASDCEYFSALVLLDLSAAFGTDDTLIDRFENSFFKFKWKNI